MKVFLFTLTLFFSLHFLRCATLFINSKNANSKLYQELARSYYIPSEEKFKEYEILEFINDTNKTIKGKIKNFNIEQCTWFIDKKPETSKKDLSQNKINLNCNEIFYIIDFSNKVDLVSKIKYNGVYKEIYEQFQKAIILEASCSFSSELKKENEELELNSKNVYVECYPYPHDINEYLKNQNREVLAGYFFYLDKPDSLAELIEQFEASSENKKIFEILTKEFSTPEKQKNQTNSSLIGRDFEFSSCEYIDTKAVSVPNSRGIELKRKIDSLLNSDLKSQEKKEELKNAIEEYTNCGTRCFSKEKEKLGFFEVWDDFTKTKVLLILKLKNQSEIQFKRYQKYIITGILKEIDFSEKGTIEKLIIEEINN